MERFAYLVTSYPKSVLLALMLITLALAPGLTNDRMRPVLEGDLPETDSRVLEDKKLQAIFPDRNFYVFNLVCPEGVFTPTCLTWVSYFVRAAEKIDGLSSPVQSIITYDYVWSTDDNIRVADLIGDNLPESAKEYDHLRDLTRNDSLLYGHLVSKDERATLVWLAMASDKSQVEVYNSLQSLVVAFTKDNHQAHAFGNHLINQELDFGVEQDVRKLLPFGLLFIAVVVILTLVWQSIFLVFAVIIMSVVWCFGLMGLLDVPRSILSGSIPLILVAVVSSASFHLIHRIRRVYRFRAVGQKLTRGSERRELVRKSTAEALARIGQPVILSGLTSALGFVTLVVFQIWSVREFGLFATVGILSGMMVSLTLIPSLVICVFNGVAIDSDGRLARQFERLNSIVLEVWVLVTARYRLAVTVISGIFLLIAIIGISIIRIGSNPPHFFPQGNAVRDGFDSFTTYFGGDGFVSVLFDSGENDGIFEPEFLRGVEKFQQMATADQKVVFASSLGDVIKRINRKFNNDKVNFEVVPDQRDLVAQYLLLYESGASETLSQMTDSSRRYLAVDFMLDVNDSAYLDQLYHRWRAEAKKIFPTRQTYFGGEFFLWSAQNQYIVIGKVLNVVTCFVVIFILCAVIFRSALAGLIALVPVALATLMVFGLMGFVGISLDLANCLITSIVVGVGVDFAIHLLFSLKDMGFETKGNGQDSTQNISAMASEAVRTAGLPINYNCLSNLAFLVFLLSAFVPLWNFGWLISLTMIIATISTLILVPTMVVRFRPRFLTFS